MAKTPAPRSTGQRRQSATATATTAAAAQTGSVTAVTGDGALPAGRFLDRELSWLDFNSRVLELARDPQVPLLERVRFLSIVASNLDEFFMVRVAGLKRRIATGLAVTGASGIPPRKLLEDISVRTQQMQQLHAEVFATEVQPELLHVGISVTHYHELSRDEQQRLDSYFADHIFPVLTPLALDPAHPFPYISGLSLNLAIILRNPATEQEHFARVKVPSNLPRFVRIDSDDPQRHRFMPIEELIAQHLEQLFPGMQVVQHHTFRVTRNEDLEVDEDDAENILQTMEKELLRRRFGPPVRLELSRTMDDHVKTLLLRELGISSTDVYYLPEPLDLQGLEVIADVDIPELHYLKYLPQTHHYLRQKRTSQPNDIFGTIQQRDILLHHPYDSFSTSVQRFLQEAAADPNVLAIKQTLYRTSGDSPIVDALIEAAQSGKQVLALVEIKARFDEEANIGWARQLERAGVHVVYGIVGLKTHAKLSLVVRQEEQGIRRYCHVGTGNYNPKTARLYEDLGVLTCDEQVAEDISRLFNQLSGYAPRTTYRRLLVAPHTLRSGLLHHIDREITNHGDGNPSGIRFKLNSIVDETIIDALYRASQAGVKVELLVRGICALKPGWKHVSINITVRSILGRYLEHSRIFWFANNGKPTVLIGSADLMHRNLDSRVEALLEVSDPAHIRELGGLLDRALQPDTASWQLHTDGTWQRLSRTKEGKAARDYQAELIATQPRRYRKARKRK